MILSGPILRRTDQAAVYIWLATSAEDTVRASLYRKDDVNTVLADSSAVNGDVTRIKAGENLYVHLIKISPDAKQTFPLDKLLLYNLWVNDQSLSDMGLIGKAGSAINYPGLPLPGFFIPSVLNNFIFASCRKPHAYEFCNDGNPDRLAAGDDLIGKAPNNLANRPAALYLVGDQIYADDVASPLLKYIKSKAQDITGKVEKIHSTKPDSTASVTPDDFILRDRQEFVTNRTDVGFTTGQGHNHLLTFGEYAAMYLSVFSPFKANELPAWNKKFKDLIVHDEEAELDDDEHIFSIEIQYIRQLKEVKYFSKTLNKVRRLLANIPTYMIFDDHDVTDDWNIDRGWEHNVATSEYGSQITANALAAYWVFQGWGNNPQQFDGAYIKAITDQLNSATHDAVKAREFRSVLAGTNWNYSLPGEKPVIVLDTRTKRHFDHASKPGRLMNDESLNWLVSEWSQLTNNNTESKPLLLVSPTPVYGFMPIEAGQAFLENIGLGNSLLDIESWAANDKGLSALEKTLSEDIKPEWCLIMSGDVHYSFSRFVDASKRNKLGAVKVWQLTSSPLKNESTCGFILRALRMFEKLLTKENNYIKPSFGKYGYIAKKNNIGYVKLTDNNTSEFQLVISNQDFQKYPVIRGV